MATPRNAKNQYITGTSDGAGSYLKANGGNLLSSTSGSMANQPQKPTTPAYGMADKIGQKPLTSLLAPQPVNSVTAQNHMANQNFAMAPGGQQMQQRFATLQSNLPEDPIRAKMDMLERQQHDQFRAEIQQGAQNAANHYQQGTDVGVNVVPVPGQPAYYGGVRKPVHETMTNAGPLYTMENRTGDGYAYTSRPKTDEENARIGQLIDERIARAEAATQARGGLTPRQYEAIQKLKREMQGGKKTAEEGMGQLLRKYPSMAEKDGFMNFRQQVEAQAVAKENGGLLKAPNVIGSPMHDGQFPSIIQAKAQQEEEDFLRRSREKNGKRVPLSKADIEHFDSLRSMGILNAASASEFEGRLTNPDFIKSFDGSPKSRQLKDAKSFARKMRDRYASQGKSFLVNEGVLFDSNNFSFGVTESAIKNLEKLNLDDDDSVLDWFKNWKDAVQSAKKARDRDTLSYDYQGI